MAEQQLEYIRGGKQKARYTEAEVSSWPCPLCGKTGGQILKVERGVLRVQRCEGCELIRINPRLTSPHEIYQGDTSVYDAEFREVRAGKPHHRDDIYDSELALIEKHKPTGNFLDVGTNAGSFLRRARGRGWTLTGVEPSPQLAAFATKWWGLDVRVGFLEELNLPSAHFDVVTMTDVFEHIVNPREVLASIRRVLKPDGLLYVKVPNALFNIVKFKVRTALGRPSDDDFDAYEHVLHYTDKTLKRMLNAAGFDAFAVFVERPVQAAVWQRYVGHYYQHASPPILDWQRYLGRRLSYEGARLETFLTRRVGWLAPNIGCLARPARS